MIKQFCTLSKGNSPIITAAIHSGHYVRKEVAEKLKISEIDRLREEDPYTSGLTEISESRIVCNRSRFEVDINRTRDKAVYISPRDAWGLDIWKSAPPDSLISNSLANYDTFYQEVKQMLVDTENQFGYFILLDFHSYNHLRNGPNAMPADPTDNPEVNIGTESIVQDYWKPVISKFLSDLSNFNYLGRHLDVRENIKFKGGNFPRWVNNTFSKSGCAIAIEVKKFFMNEWTSEIYQKEYETLKKALATSIPSLIKEISCIKNNKETIY